MDFAERLRRWQYLSQADFYNVSVDRLMGRTENREVNR